MKELTFVLILLVIRNGLISGQQEFFLDSWKPKNIQVPEYIEAEKPIEPANLSVTIHASDTITRIPVYMFGDNANAYTGSMSDNKELMKHLADRNMGVLRGPSGSIADVYFWNRSEYSRPEDVPETLLAGGSDNNWPWYGKRPNSWDAGWTMDVDSFYSILEQAGVTGLITVNYGYARYGTGEDPVAQAAHLAADWVRYDHGRTRFWEIGNEVFGSWEAGYRIDVSLNKDGQPEYINGTLYGQHCRVYIDSMKAAANETGAEIFIGAVVAEGSGSDQSNWNEKLMTEVGDVIDFYIVHSYFTPWQQNSTASTILNSAAQTKEYMDYLSSVSDKVGKPMRPVALTEYNIFAIGSHQMVSQINGMHAVLVTGEAIRNKIGAACRWDLANGYGEGDDHGMYSYGSEPGVEKYAPRPAFYYLYYMQKYLGDVLLNNSVLGSEDVVVYSSAFNSGHTGAILVNKGPNNTVARINIENATVGNRYYTYTLIGGEYIFTDPSRPYSRKVSVNGFGPPGVAGGPADYDTIRAKSFVTGDEILVETPPYSAVYLLVDSGNVQLKVNNKIGPLITWNEPADIVYGTVLTSKQLNASTGITGQFIYNPPAATLLDAGTGIDLTVTFIPGDTTNYTEVTRMVRINVKKATPLVFWDIPPDINYGTLLSEAQLNATANVKGIFLYDPPAGTLLNAGAGQDLKVTFTPNDEANYNSVAKTVKINVNAADEINNTLVHDLHIYPVPATDILMITPPDDTKPGQEMKYSVCSVDGRIISSLRTINDGTIVPVNVKDLPSGIYLLRCQTDRLNLMKRFIKL